MLIMAGGGGFLLLLIFTAFIWPGFLMSGGGGATTEGLRYLPADTRIVVGVDFTVSGSAVIKTPVLEAMKSMQEDEGREYFEDAKWMLVGMSVDSKKGAPVPTGFVLNTTKAHDPEKVRKTFKAGDAEKLKGGQTVYKVKEPVEGVLYFANPNTIVFCALANDKFEALLGGTGGMPPELLAQSQRLSPNTVWAVVSLDGEIGKKVKEGTGGLGKMKEGPGAGLEDALSALGNAKFFTARATSPDGKKLTCELGVVCASSSDASKAQAALAPKIKGLTALLTFLPDLPKDLGKDLEALKVQASGVNLTMDVTFSESVVTEASGKIKDQVAGAGGSRPVKKGGGPAGGGNFRKQSENNMKQLVLGMHSYHDARKLLPKQNNKPGLSWRVEILPYIDQLPLYQEFNLKEPWHSEHNMKLLSKMPDVYKPLGVPAPPNTTFYQVFTGKDTLFDNNGSDSSLGRIADGTSNTTCIIEAADPVIWTQPADLELQEGRPLPRVGGLFKGSYHIAFADASVAFFEPMPETLLRSLVFPNSGMPRDHESLNKYRK